MFRPSVLSFFNAHATSGYDSSQFNAGIDTSLHTQGFDCSGFVGWTVYNTLNASSGGASIDEVLGAMTSYLTNKGYTYISTNSGFKPGDIAWLRATMPGLFSGSAPTEARCFCSLQ